MKFPIPLLLLGLTTQESLALPNQPRVKELFSYPPTNPIFLEAIYPLPDGRFLVSHFTSSTIPGPTPVLVFDPRLPNPTPQEVLILPNISGQTGIAPLGQNRYAITTGHLEGIAYQFGTVNTHIISLPPFAKKATLLDSIPAPAGSILMNGLAPLPGRKHIILSADSGTGSILRINTLTRMTDTLIQHPRLGPGNNTVLPIGINGLRVKDDYVYFTQTAQGFFGRIKINPLTGDIKPNAKIETVSLIGGGEVGFENAFDDFTFEKSENNAYITRHSQFLVKVNLATGKQEVIVGPGNIDKDSDNGVRLKGPTAVTLGLSGKELFVTTSGQVDGVRIGGQVVSVQL
ncbi:hypothetical protein QBC35DRAFT_501047 [Podospora australis]|uniref:SMP-30/Gluconolactonase/LRE-like region domain-containing protein n=1 Tax=Podospora australis TaxID=1536484 RepID=A0AAN7AI29_9PEZI|nr:hypothetical protein QBC35DRAFT_501047 [Podospora australis]